VAKQRMSSGARAAIARKSLVKRVAQRLAKTAQRDAETCTSYEEEFFCLARRVAEGMSDTELKAFLRDQQ